MKRSTHTTQFNIRNLMTVAQLIEQGKSFVVSFRVIEATQPSYHRLRHQYGCMHAEVVIWLTQLR